MNKILRFIFLAIILLALMLLAPQTLALFASGFDHPEVLEQFKFYIVTGIPFLLGIALIFFATLFMVKKGYSQYGDGVSFSEVGSEPALSFFKRFTNFQLFYLSTILFFIVGLSTYLTKQQTFTGLGTLPQQFTAGQSIIFSSLLIPISENLGLGFVIALSLLGLRVLCKKYSLSKENFKGLSYFIVLIGGAFGWAWHQTVYAASDIAQAVVFFFWTIGSFLTIITGSFIPFWVMHLTNNMFFDLKRSFSNEVILIYVVFVLIILTTLYFLIYRGRLLGAKREIKIDSTGDVI